MGYGRRKRAEIRPKNDSRSYTGDMGKFFHLCVFGLRDPTQRSFTALFEACTPPITPDKVVIKYGVERGTGVAALALFTDEARRDEVYERQSEFGVKLVRNDRTRKVYRASSSMIARLFQRMADGFARFERDHFPMKPWCPSNPKHASCSLRRALLNATGQCQVTLSLR